MEKIKITLNINDKPYDVRVFPNDTLLEVLRDELDLTGSKESCGEGVCGSCTVHMDGNPVRSCLTLAMEATGTKIKTVEGLATEDDLSDLQQSFIDHGAVQCGFCTPGMLMSADALLNKNSKPDEKTVRKALAGNICRCTGYAKIVEAVAHTGNPQDHCPDCKTGGKTKE
ncbi:(2Fe-2S)-binding protein [Desulfobacula sp.]|uniref:(2Fe-2S)-binding protein n=1 Tax=Desulfobacula sp. TaxID=2593537 RepID=UPI0025C1B045|nr:(2Fe-2S)-binding protein [Desulfobacula sp.]MBC2703451.1 (2Fe-2S)-binding protein [Desulfobacula sp.]